MKSDNIGLEGGVVKKEDCLQLNEKNIDILLFIIVEGSSSPTHTRTHAHTDTCKHWEWLLVGCLFPDSLP